MQSASPARTEASRKRLPSLERRLPLLMAGLLTVMLVTSLALTYAELVTSANESAALRLERATDQLGSLAVTSTGLIRSRLDSVAGERTLRSALELPHEDTAAMPPAASATLDSARATLDDMLSANDTGLTVELWSEDGRRVAYAGRDLSALSVQSQAPESGHPLVGPPTFDTLEQTDSVQIGELYVVDSIAHFWAVAPITIQGSRAGYLARQYRITQNPRLDETIRALIGTEVTAYYRNSDGQVWTKVSGGAASAPAARDSTGEEIRVSRPELGELIAVESPIAGTPLVLVLERPVSSVQAGAMATLRKLAIVSILLLLVGGAAALVISRRITRPLAELTAATEAVAHGHYETRVRSTGNDELARLANSFNRMSAEVGAAHAELEMQTEEAQTTAEELDQSNHELAAAVRDLAEREEQFRVLANAIPLLAWTAHADGSIFWYNERWYSYTGCTAEQMEGWGWQSVHDPEVLPRVMVEWKRSIALGISFETEFPLRGADGRYRRFLTRAHPVRDAHGRVVRWFGTNTDIQIVSEARDAAEAASSDAQRARAQAEAANQAKSEFLAVMSHELRTPLNAIGGYTELLELGLRGPVTEAQRRDLDRIRTSQQHLLGLISGVLDLSRIEAGRVSYDLASVRLDPFLAGLDDLVEPQAAAKSLSLEYNPCDPQLAVRADREKLRQILLNLLSNAIRYTPPGGRIVLTAEAGDDITAAIMVSDTGIGIDPGALERIFEPFVQLDRSLTQAREGVGLGLAISLDLARGMNGDIRAESSTGQGSRFTLTLPLATVAEGQELAPSSGEFPVVGRAEQG